MTTATNMGVDSKRPVVRGAFLERAGQGSSPGLGAGRHEAAWGTVLAHQAAILA